jgi:hypothetical protein
VHNVALRQLESVTCVDALEPRERLMILPSPYDRIGQHAGTGGAALDRQIEGIGHEDLGLGAAGTIFAHKFLIQDLDDDGGRGPPLEYGASVRANELEGFGFALDLGWHDLDLHARQVLG